VVLRSKHIVKWLAVFLSWLTLEKLSYLNSLLTQLWCCLMIVAASAFFLLFTYSKSPRRLYPPKLQPLYRSAEVLFLCSCVFSIISYALRLLSVSKNLPLRGTAVAFLDVAILSVVISTIIFWACLVLARKHTNL